MKTIDSERIKSLADNVEGVFYALQMLKEKLQMSDELDPDRKIQSIINLVSLSAQSVNIELAEMLERMQGENNAPNRLR